MSILQPAKRAVRKFLTFIEAKPRPYASDFSMQVPFSYAVPPAPPKKIAAVCHIFYAELAAEMRGYLAHIPGDVDVFISTDDAAKKAHISAAFSGWGKGSVAIRIAPNRGRDIAPKLVTFKDVYMNYALVLCIHSKKTAYSDVGDTWRRMLLNDLAGSPQVVASILEAFEREPRLGMVVPQHFEPIRKYLVWGRTYFAGLKLGLRMGFFVPLTKTLDFPSGSMFWARPAALRPLLALNLKIEDFAPEEGQIDGTVAHAIERLFFHACEHAGYDWVKVAEPSGYAERATIVPIDSPAAIERFMKMHGVDLL